MTRQYTYRIPVGRQKVAVVLTARTDGGFDAFLPRYPKLDRVEGEDRITVLTAVGEAIRAYYTARGVAVRRSGSAA